MSKSTAYKSSATAPSLFSTSTKFETKTCKVRNEELPSFIRSNGKDESMLLLESVEKNIVVR